MGYKYFLFDVACFQASKRRADRRLARCGITSTASTATITIRQHDALALISRVGIGAIFFLSGCTKVEGWLISVCCRWRTGPRQRQRAARNSLLRHARPPCHWVPNSRYRLNQTLLAPVLIAACARSAWAGGEVGIKEGLVALSGGRHLATGGWYTRLIVGFRLIAAAQDFDLVASKQS